MKISNRTFFKNLFASGTMTSLKPDPIEPMHYTPPRSRMNLFLRMSGLLLFVIGLIIMGFSYGLSRHP